MIITVNYQIILIIFEMVTHDDICTDMRIYVRTPVLLLFSVDSSFRLLRFYEDIYTQEHLLSFLCTSILVFVILRWSYTNAVNLHVNLIVNLRK